jgi:Zn-dependent protease
MFAATIPIDYSPIHLNLLTMDQVPPVVYGSTPPPLPPEFTPQPPPEPPRGSGFKKAAGPLAALGVLLAKFKAAIIPALKFAPAILKTGGTMLLSMWAYTYIFGWRFAVGFVILIFVHECGHLIAAKLLGLNVSAPMFIPFFGAFIMLRDKLRNAWIEALVGISGPILGTVGATICFIIYCVTGNQLFGALANTGFFINLFNLAPIGFLDGGRIVTALSPWLWIVGAVLMLLLMVVSFNPFVLIIFILCLPRLFSLFRHKSAEQLRYFEVEPSQRVIIGIAYFGLIAYLVLGMVLSEVNVHREIAIQ